jgi:ferric iron reductase protein FhuF
LIAELAPFFPGQLRAFGEGVTAQPAAASAWPGTRLREAEALTQRLAQYGGTLGAADLPAIASWWARRYCLLVMPPVLVAAAVWRRAAPVALHQVHIAFGGDGRVQRMHLASASMGHPDAWPAHDSLDACLAPLTREQFAPVFEALTRVSRVSPRVLWSHAAEIAHRVGAALLPHPALDGERRATIAAWLASETSEFGEVHPYRSPYRHIHVPQMSDALAAPAQRVRRVCCLKYRLPADDYCAVCPLLRGPNAKPA